MRILLAAAISLAPLTALADDAPAPAPAPAPSVQVNIYNNAPPAPQPAAPVVAPEPVVSPVVAPEPVAAPPSAAPIIAPAPAVDDHCAHKKWGWHGGKRRGFFALGIASSRVELEDESEHKQKSFIARAQGRRGFGVELELARAHIGEDNAKSAGGSLFKAFGKRRLMPYVIVGGGRGVIDRADGSESRMRYREAGAGLMLKGRRIALGVDFRRGSRSVETPELDEAAPPQMDSPTTPAVVTPTDDDDRERYVRGRIMALITF